MRKLTWNEVMTYVLQNEATQSPRVRHYNITPANEKLSIWKKEEK